MDLSLKNWKIHVLVCLLIAVAEWIGVHKITLGTGVIVLLPLLYAMIFGAVISWPRFKILSDEQMDIVSKILGYSFMLFVAKLGLMMGPSLAKIFSAGASLSLQEVGHFIGTIILGLPIAIMLGMKREAIGATFSIDREPNLAIISEKYGAGSPELRGALGVYICGTLFGAMYLSVLASLIGGLKFFDPIALAMGAGVGSGSMMVAITGSLSVIYPDQAKDIAMFAGAANLLTTIVGTYVCVFFSLPAVNYFYDKLEPALGNKKGEIADAG